MTATDEEPEYVNPNLPYMGTSSKPSIPSLRNSIPERKFSATSTTIYEKRKFEWLSILSVITSALFFISGFAAIVGIILGHIALSRTKSKNTSGKWVAIAGLVIGYGFVFYVVLSVFLGVYNGVRDPNILNSKY